MKLIPVIDLMQGQVVWARGGIRHRYCALSSELCPDSDPLGLACRLVQDFGADTLYVADLDAIRGIGHNGAVLSSFARSLPNLHLWVDAGLSDRDSLARFLDQGAGRPVIGSETLSEISLLCEPQARGAVLSLDFRGAHLIGPPELAQSSELWSQDLILMSLQRVGSATGPDLPQLARYRALAPHSRCYSAGGVRDIRDLERLRAAGAAGVLLASALHDGRITAEAMAALR